MAVKHFDLMKEYLKDCETHDRPWELWEVGFPRQRPEWVTLVHHPYWDDRALYRRKPKTITINGIEVPAPLEQKPEMGVRYYGVKPDGMTFSAPWANDTIDNAVFKFGIWATQEDAQRVAEAIAKALKP